MSSRRTLVARIGTLRRARERLETSDTATLMTTEVLDWLDSGRAGRAA